jgi:hypothetical protein
MLQSVTASRPSSHALEFGLYRDGDNNLDEVQEKTVEQAQALSARDSSIAFTVEDTTSGYGIADTAALHTEEYTIEQGKESAVKTEMPHDMSSRANLAQFVARTLDNAEKTHASQTWLDLIDHGGGDGGGLQADHGQGVMRSDDISGAIADGVALHARKHPEDAERRVDGVIANQCLMATVAFSSSQPPLPPPRSATRPNASNSKSKRSAAAAKHPIEHGSIVSTAPIRRPRNSAIGTTAHTGSTRRSRPPLSPASRDRLHTRRGLTSHRLLLLPRATPRGAGRIRRFRTRKHFQT